MSQGKGKGLFTRPGFIVFAVVVALVVAGGGAFAAITAVRGGSGAGESASAASTVGHEQPQPSSAPSATPDGNQSSTPDGNQSVCGLTGEVLGTAYLTEAPAVDHWDYQGTMAYPVSATYGPGATDSTGFHYCFQHSPEGAVYAAANAAVQADGADEDLVVNWLEYFLADSPERDELMSQDTSSSNNSGGSQGTRLQIAGFLLLAYDGATARVDIAVTGSVDGQAVKIGRAHV